MTDETLNTPDLDAGEAVPVDFDLDDWIDGGSVSQRSVPIYSRPDLMADYEEWERRYKDAETRTKAGDVSLGDEDELAALEAEGEALLKQWQASKADWRVRALSIEEIEEIAGRAPTFPDLPKFLEPEPALPRDHSTGKAPSGAWLAGKAAWTARHDAFLSEQKPEADALAKKRAAAVDETNLESIAAAVVSIDFANGAHADGVTVAQLRKMRAKIGPNQVARLIQAATLATYAEPDLSVPFSRATSKGDRT